VTPTKTARTLSQLPPMLDAASQLHECHQCKAGSRHLEVQPGSHLAGEDYAAHILKHLRKDPPVHPFVSMTTVDDDDPQEGLRGCRGCVAHYGDHFFVFFPRTWPTLDFGNRSAYCSFHGDVVAQ